MVEKPIEAPFSGEIIPGEDRGVEPFGRRDTAHPSATQIVDAEYETLPGGFEPARSAARPAAGAPAAATRSGLEMLRGGTAGQTASRPLPLWIAGFAAVATMFWLSGGHALLEHARPPAAKSASLSISALESRIERSAGGDRLIIDGEAVNEGGAPGLLLDLSINILGANGRTTRYFLGTNGAALAAGERFAFSSRLAAPKGGVRSVSVTFRE